MADQDPRGRVPRDEEVDDTDEQFQDRPEEAPDQSRISVEKIKSLEDEPIRRLANTGDIVEDAGEKPAAELRFDRNQDFAGNEASLDTDADYSRGSGFLGGKLIGEPPASEEEISEPTSNRGFDPSAEQAKNIAAARRQSPQPGRSGPADMGGDLRDQGRDIGRRDQVTGLQRFGRDMGSSGLSELGEHFEAADLPQHDASTKEHEEWSRVLRRLGGSSPGSAENLQLTEKFGVVQFPATHDAVLRKLAPGTEFRIKEGIAIDLRQAVMESHTEVFRNMNDLIDCVKDALRRAEFLERHHA
jgi:hypothetical protein